MVVATDREGAVAHARMLSDAGYGVLLYDARGRGRSAGHENAFGWRWDRDVRGAVDFLTRRGVNDIALLGLSTGAEAVITEAADDPRVRAVIADGVQLRTAADAAALPAAARLGTQPFVALAGAEIGAVTGERQPPPLSGLIRRAASDRPLLMIATIPLERTIQHRYARGTKAQVWELSDSGHTRGLRNHPNEYKRRVVNLLRSAR
jgi:pimeloyl-ACP methyl ester carboxylesterase